MESPYHIILYEGLVATGELLHPVIFTDCPSIPMDLDKDIPAKVLFIPNVTSPSATLTLHWLGEVDKYLEEGSLIVHDRGGEYTAKKVREELKEKGYGLWVLPSAGGAYGNPCDNSFNATLKWEYWRDPGKTIEEKIKAVIRAYYAARKESIQNYFHHCGWTGERPTKAFIHQLLSEGYQPGKRHKALYEELTNTYLAWRKNLREAPQREWVRTEKENK